MMSSSISTPGSPRWIAPRTARGFSLVEVVLALGIAAFGLVPILGLFSSLAGSSQQADNATVLASMSLQAADQLRNGANSTTGVASSIYFDHDGTLTTAADPTAYYVCQLSTTAAAQAAGALPANLVSATLQFSWPATAPAAAQTTRKVFATAPYRP